MTTTEAPLRRLGDIMRPKVAPSPLEDEAIKEVYAMATELDALPAQSRPAYVVEIRTQTTARQRHLATRHTPPDHPMFAPLMAMLDALIATQPGIVHTSGGIFTVEDVAAHHGKIAVEEGRRLLVFPWTWPWRIKPDKETGREGVRGDPLYRTPEQRAPHLYSFRAGSYTDADTTVREPEWWEKKS